MKSFALVAAALPVLALAAPMNDGKKSDSYKQHGAKYISNGVFDFTSTYYAKATPDQVHVLYLARMTTWGRKC